MLPLQDKLDELQMENLFYADDTVLHFVLGSNVCIFDNFLTSIQRWFSNAKLKLNADKNEYMIIRKYKIVEHGLLRLREGGDFTEQIKVLACYIYYQFTLQRQINFV